MTPQRIGSGLRPWLLRILAMVGIVGFAAVAIWLLVQIVTLATSGDRVDY